MLSNRLLSVSRRSSSRTLHHLALAGALVSTFAVTACSGDSSTSPSTPQVPGAYPMATARGMPVPHTFTDAAGSKLTIQGGGLTMTSAGAYTLAYKGKLNALTFDLSDEGTFTVSGSIVTFKPDGEPSYTGRIQGRTVIIDDFKIAGAKFDLAFQK
jgi:hypothetical protein